MLRRASNWFSPTVGSLQDHQMIERIETFVHSEPDRPYRLALGTDSMPNLGGPVYLVTALLVHQVGHGGIYFWQRKVAGPFPTMRHRIRAEADRSIRLAKHLLSHRSFLDLINDGLPIHLDIGTNGDTRSVIQEVANLVRQQGFSPAIKPDAYVASRIAHRHTAIPQLITRPA